jgi:D-alanine-D-alanine ligase
MRVLLLHGEVPAEAPRDELDTLVQADSVAASLRRLGHEPLRGLIRMDLGACIAEWTAARPDIVFSLIESIAGRTELVPIAYPAVDCLGLPYTGSPLPALVATTDKLWAKKLMRLAGIPTADFFTSADLRRLPADARLDGDFLVKPVCLDGSLGLTDDSRMRTPHAGELLSRLSAKERECRVPFFAERFLPGREYKVALLSSAGDEPVEVLPILEISYRDDHPVSFLTYDMQWRDDHPLWDTVGFEAAGPEISGVLAEVARRCWHAFGLMGWARVDVRLDAAGRPHVLEVNCNPGLAPNAGFVVCAARAGLEHDAIIQRILAAATTR